MAEPTPSSWTQQAERGGVPIIRFMIWLSLRLGRRLSRVVLFGIAAYFLVFGPRARAGVQGFYQRLYGRRASWRELYKHFLSFSTTIHDRIFLLAGRYEEVQVQLSVPEDVRTVLRAERGVVVLGAHFGSFEALRGAADELHKTAVMLMYPDNATKLGSLLAELNPEVATHIVALNRPDSMLQVQEHIEQGHLLGILADRNFTEDDSLAWEFLGAPVQFPQGPMRLAALLRCPVLLMAGIYVEGNCYDVQAQLIADFSDCERSQRQERMAQAQQAYVQGLEQLCRKYPHNWFNFYDFWQMPKER